MRTGTDLNLDSKEGAPPATSTSSAVEVDKGRQAAREGEKGLEGHRVLSAVMQPQSQPQHVLNRSVGSHCLAGDWHCPGCNFPDCSAPGRQRALELKEDRKVELRIGVIYREAPPSSAVALGSLLLKLIPGT